MKKNNIENLCVNTIRGLSIDAIEKAKSGHPGAPMGMASMGFLLWAKILKHNPDNPLWFNRDRFILSAGHASMLLYSLLHLTGYKVSLDDLKNFRQMGSKTPGHPEYKHTDGVETTTGPLGQGFANSVGFAIAEAHLSSIFNTKKHKVINHFTYVFCGDGDLMEGISSEAASLAGHLGLGKLICLYDDNGISIEGKTSITFTENVEKKFQALNWQTIKVRDGNNLKKIEEAILSAQKEKNKPSLIMVKTKIAYGSPNKEGSENAHGSPLGIDEIKLTKKNLGLDPDKDFFVPEEVQKEFNKVLVKGRDLEKKWNLVFENYKKEEPALYKKLIDMIEGKISSNFFNNLISFNEDKLATRVASGKVLNAIAKKLPSLVGGSADLAPSNNTYLKDFGDFQKGNFNGRNIRFGVREHSMGAIMAGMYLHGALRPFGGTFLVFSDYLRPAIRVAALMKIPLIYIFTHDSIAVGEDGPTHQPVEHTASLRLIPNLNVIRPGDAFETIEGFKLAIESKESPTALILSRQNLPVLKDKKELIENGVKNGAYIISQSNGKIDLILIATGSELHLAILAKEELEKKNINSMVVSFPSTKHFEKMPQSYKDKVLPPQIQNRIIIEAGISSGWEKYLGEKGIIIGIDSFGLSAPGDKVLDHFGFSKDNIVKKALTLLNK